MYDEEYYDDLHQERHREEARLRRWGKVVRTQTKLRRGVVEKAMAL